MFIVHGGVLILSQMGKNTFHSSGEGTTKSQDSSIKSIKKKKYGVCSADSTRATGPTVLKAENC